MRYWRYIKWLVRLLPLAVPGAGGLFREALVERLPELLGYWPFWGPGALAVGLVYVLGARGAERRLDWVALARHFQIAERAEKIHAERELDIENYRPGCYLPRGLEDEIVERLRKAAGLVIVAKPTSGKTRLCYEALHRLRGWYVLYPRAEILRYEAMDFSILKGKKVVLFLNDLHKYVDKLDPQGLWKKVGEEASACALLANCRDGHELRLVEEKLGYFWKTLSWRLQLEDLSEEQAKELAEHVGKEWYDVPFDGTPGSVVLDLRGMADRYSRLDPNQQAALRTLKLLHAAHISEMRLDLAQAACEIIWGVDLSRTQWLAMWQQLQSNSFLKVHSSQYVKVYDPYLEQCIADYQAPEEDFGKLFELLAERRDEDTILYLAGAYWDGERRLEACQCIEAVLAINPKNGYAHGSYAYVLAKMGDEREAQRHYREALDLLSDNAWLHRNYADLLVSMGSTEEAQQHWAKALSLGSSSGDQLEDGEWHTDYANFLDSIGRKDEAQREYLAAAYLLPPDHLSRPTYLVRGGRPEEAEAYYQEKLRAKPDDAAWHAAYGAFLHYVGRDEEAKARYQEALRLRPGDAMLYVGYAWLLVEMGDAQEAETHCLTALRLNPNDNIVHQVYAAVLRKLGRTAEADYHRREAERLRKEGKGPDRKTGL